MNKLTNLSNPIIPTFFLLLLVLMDIKSFVLWDQVYDLWYKDVNPLITFFIHPHGPRYLLVWPVFYISSLLSISPNLFFSYVIVFVFFISLVIFKKSLMINPFFKVTTPHFLLSYFLFLFLILLMNGRLIFAILSTCIFLYLYFSKINLITTFILALVCLFLSSVSSGTFTVVLFWIFSYFIFSRISKITDFFYFLPLVLFMFLFSKDYFILVLNKNLNYYGGGIDGVFNMLTHGLGRFLLIDSISIFLILFIFIITSLIIFLILVFSIKVISSNTIMLMFLVVVSFLGGLFGFSTLVFAFPLLLVFTFHVYDSIASH